MLEIKRMQMWQMFRTYWRH